MPNKVAKYGLKIQVTYSETHYMLNVKVYAGKTNTEKGRKNFAPSDNQNCFPPPHLTDVVCRLMEAVKNTSRNITVDNWYSSLDEMR